MSGYTIVDLETTGLFPSQHDRIIEIGLVEVSDDGQIEDEWTTLVNPQRDVGPTHIHGLTARDILEAPTFSQIAPRIIASLQGRTLVAHNARFDTAFLESEFARAGVALRPPTPSLCTMELSSSFLRGSSRKLRDCCAAADIPHVDPHTAAGDARAVAGLLRYYLRAAGQPVPWTARLVETRAHWWPAHGPLAELEPWPRPTAPHRPDAWLDRITSNLPRNPAPAVEAYLSVLEKALLDGYLSAHEEEALVDLATTLGLHRDQLAAIHMTYLDSMTIAAWADGTVTETERRELEQVARLLGIPLTLIDVSLSRAERFAERRRTTTFTLTPGDQLAFTGQLSVPRDQLVALVRQSGLVVGGINRRTKLVVAADPDSLSGKAAKARDYGIPVVTEAAFARMLSDLC